MMARHIWAEIWAIVALLLFLAWAGEHRKTLQRDIEIGQLRDELHKEWGEFNKAEMRCKPANFTWTHTPGKRAEMFIPRGRWCVGENKK